MRLLADENIDGRLVAALRKAGHEITWVAETMPGAVDAAVLETARTEEALLVTDDLDFGELVFRQRRATCGVLLLRLAGLSAAHKADIVSQALRIRGTELAGRFGVLDAHQLRIRPFEL